MTACCRVALPRARCWNLVAPARPIGTRGLVCYLLGIAASIPFMSGSYFTGFLAPHLGGADFSYFIGFAVAGLAYLISERRALVQI